MPLRSMTGFGRAVADVGGRRHVVEIRSVNSRGLDVKVRAGDGAAALELEIGRAVRAVLGRGAVQISVGEDRPDGAGLGWDPGRLRAVHAALVRESHALGIPGAVDLATVAAWWHASGEGRASAPAWEALRGAVIEALDALLDMRRKEGSALAADLRGHLEGLASLRNAMGGRARVLPERFARRLSERLSALAPAVALDPGRMAQEVATMAERLDVSEELARLAVHLDQFAGALEAADSPAGVGRRLEFLVQEIGREVNTIGAKAQDAEIAARVIDAKVTLEKIREQVQNVE